MATEMSNAELAAQLLEFKNWLVAPMEDVPKPKKTKGKKAMPEKDENGKFMKKSKSKGKGKDKSSESENASSSGDDSPVDAKPKNKRAKDPTTHEQDTQDKFVHNRGKKQKQINVDPVVEADADPKSKPASKSATPADAAGEAKAKSRGGPRF